MEVSCSSSLAVSFSHEIMKLHHIEAWGLISCDWVGGLPANLSFTLMGLGRLVGVMRNELSGE